MWCIGCICFVFDVSLYASAFGRRPEDDRKALGVALRGGLLLRLLKGDRGMCWIMFLVYMSLECFLLICSCHVFLCTMFRCSFVWLQQPREFCNV